MNPELVSSLNPPRLPTEFAQLGYDDLLAMFGIGLLLAVLILTIFSPMLRKRVRVPGVQARIAEAAKFPPQERVLRLVQLLYERGGTLPDDLRDALYKGEVLDPKSIESLIRRAKR